MTDVVVVGAGVAGLAAARALEAAGATVQVVEGRARAGGRTFTADWDGIPADLGGTWIGPQQQRIGALVDELGIERVPQFAQGQAALEFGGRVRRYAGTIPKLSPLALLEVHRLLGRIDGLAKTIPEGRPWAAPRAAEWDAASLASWRDRHVWSAGARASFNVAARSVLSADPKDVSTLYFLHYVRSAGGILPLIDTEGGAQQDRLAGGVQQVSERLAEQLQQPVRYGFAVRRVEHDGGVVVSGEGGEVRADRAILAIPPSGAAAVAFEPLLPARRAMLQQRMPMGASIKVLARYRTPFWRDEGRSGEAVSDDGPIHLCFDVSPPGGPGVLVGFFLGDSARRASATSEAERRAAALDCFARWFGERARNPEATIEKDWNADPWTRGCSVGLLSTGGWTAVGDAIREPVGRLHWAGTETATVWMGFLDGAVQSGERAAAEVLAAG